MYLPGTFLSGLPRIRFATDRVKSSSMYRQQHRCNSPSYLGHLQAEAPVQMHSRDYVSYSSTGHTSSTARFAHDIGRSPVPSLSHHSNATAPNKVSSAFSVVGRRCHPIQGKLRLSLIGKRCRPLNKGKLCFLFIGSRPAHSLYTAPQHTHKPYTAPRHKPYICLRKHSGAPPRPIARCDFQLTILKKLSNKNTSD